MLYARSKIHFHFSKTTSILELNATSFCSKNKTNGKMLSNHTPPKMKQFTLQPKENWSNLPPTRNSPTGNWKPPLAGNLTHTHIYTSIPHWTKRSPL